MTKTIIYSNNIILPGGLFDGFITAEDGVITAIMRDKPESDGELIDAGGHYVAPGFVDIHVHGGGGHDFMDGSADAIIGAATAHLRHGTTTLLPTATAGSDDELFAFFEAFHEARVQLNDGPCLPGVHLEGPYLNPKQAGAQDARLLRHPDRAHCERILERAGGAIARWSIAPELPGAVELGDFLHARGIRPSIAHTDAQYAQVLDAYNHHFTSMTHFYSCMSTITRDHGYRRLGAIESGYAIEDMDVEVIADGHHLPPELLTMIYRLKGSGHIALVTDAMRAAGMPDGEYTLGSLAHGLPAISEGGVAKLPDRSAFAGSVATADTLVRVMAQQAGVGIVDAVRMMTATPARMAGLERRKGVIAAGLDCDLVMFDEDIDIKAVIVGGKAMSY